MTCTVNQVQPGVRQRAAQRDSGPERDERVARVGHD
jgi:hypothetical protein